MWIDKPMQQNRKVLKQTQPDTWRNLEYFKSVVFSRGKNRLLNKMIWGQLGSHVDKNKIRSYLLLHLQKRFQMDHMFE